MEAFFKNYSQTYIDINFLPCFGVGDLTPEVFQSILHIRCIRFYKCGCGQNNAMWRMACGPQVGHLVLNNHSPPCKPENSYQYVSCAPKDRTVMAKRWAKASTGKQSPWKDWRAHRLWPEHIVNRNVCK